MHQPVLSEQDTGHQLPRVSVVGAAVTCGVLFALAVQILLNGAGIDFATAWRSLPTAQGLPMRSALAWWLIAGCALAVSAIVTMVMSRFAPPWRRFRLARWMLGIAVVAGLAEIGHRAVSTVDAPHGAGIQLAVSLVVFAIALAMALAGASFAARR
jgi:hypothetical protein